MAIPHGVQARAVVEFVLHLVHPRGDRIAARHGDRSPIGLHGHTARQAAADQAGRQHGHLVQELLDALGAEQGTVQILEILRIGIFRCDFYSEIFIHRHPDPMDTRPAHPGIIFVFGLLPFASKSNVGADSARNEPVRRRREWLKPFLG
jgi:hypothetical protein